MESTGEAEERKAKEELAMVNGGGLRWKRKSFN